MTLFDWLVFGAFVGFIIWDGVRRARRAKTAEDYLLAGRSVPWWAMGLSVMATQASAVTLVGTTGKGFEGGTRFIQFYYALPLALLIVGLTVVPLFHRMRSFTAYEFLESRFGRGTRLLCAATFLVLRCLSLGVIIAAAAVVLSVLFQVPISATVFPMGAIAIVYTTFGGLPAVIATDVKQMAVMALGLVIALFVAFDNLPDAVGLGEAWELADAAGRLTLLDTRFDPTDRYNIWSSLLGATFLFLAYFGTDQSQVQRYLSGRSLRDKQAALLFNAVLKIPFQLLVLLVGVLLFLWSLFDPTPVVFDPSEGEVSDERVEGHATLNRGHQAALRRAGDFGLAMLDLAPGPERRLAEQGYLAALEEARVARSEASLLRERTPGSGFKGSDSNHVMPYFLFRRFPAGLAGLLLAAIFAAALSSIDSELNALATVAVVDVLRVDVEDPEQQPRIVFLSRVMTVVAGTIASGFALFVAGRGPVIEVVNEVGSLFYGSLLGVFALAFLDRKAHGLGAAVGLCTGIATVAVTSAVTELAFLWQNTLGTATTFFLGSLISRVTRR